MRDEHEKERILLVDDDAAVLRAYKNTLTRSGYAVDTAADGLEAASKIPGGGYEAIISDVSMPNIDGLEFLRIVRQHDLDVPVILMTGAPEVDSAMRAVEFGAYRYLAKPVEPDELEKTARRAIRLHKLARLKREALEMFGTEGKKLGDRASFEARYTMAVRLLWMAYQPIVSWKEKRVFGYEALLRSAEPTLLNPVAFIGAAERLGRLNDLGRAIRSRAGEEAVDVPDDARLFVNLHSADLNDEDLYRPNTPLAKIAGRVVLEITERASLDNVKNVDARVAALRAMGYRVAIDDLGAGYAGLSSFTQLGPDIAKLDMSLVRDIDTQPRKQSIVRSMKQLCDELGILVVAEGVETVGERDQLVVLGCDLLQGYLFAKPGRGFCAPAF